MIDAVCAPPERRRPPGLEARVDSRRPTRRWKAPHFHGRARILDKQPTKTVFSNFSKRCRSLRGGCEAFKI